MTAIAASNFRLVLYPSPAVFFPMPTSPKRISIAHTFTRLSLPTVARIKHLKDCRGIYGSILLQRDVTAQKRRGAYRSIWVSCPAYISMALMIEGCNRMKCRDTALQAGRSRVRFPIMLLEYFTDIILAGRTMALGSTQPLTEMSARGIFWRVKAVGVYSWQPYHLSLQIIFKSGSFNLLEPSGPLQACTGNV
jgi:hypothetical protein